MSRQRRDIKNDEIAEEMRKIAYLRMKGIRVHTKTCRRCYKFYKSKTKKSKFCYSCAKNKSQSEAIEGSEYE